MARGTTKDGFHIDDIVNIKPEHTISNQEQPEDNGVRSVLIGTRSQKRVQKLVYLTVKQKRQLAKYGRHIGKVNGGASQIVEDALEEYFANHPLNK